MTGLLFSNTSPILIVLLGPPGAGKGTHAPALGSHFQIPHISTGDLLRQNILDKTPIGIKAQGFMDHGKLVPDGVVLEMLFSRLSESDCKYGAILDGVPRTIAQAEAIDDKLGNTHKLCVFLLNLDENLLVERICGRIACKCCGKPYHKKYDPPRSEKCVCGGNLVQRVDDTEEVLKKRLDVYHTQTEPLLSYYKPILQKIDANQTKSEVFNKMTKLLASEPLLV